jgi:hypothetical protein
VDELTGELQLTRRRERSVRDVVLGETLWKLSCGVVNFRTARSCLPTSSRVVIRDFTRLRQARSKRMRPRKQTIQP